MNEYRETILAELNRAREQRDFFVAVVAGGEAAASILLQCEAWVHIVDVLEEKFGYIEGLCECDVCAEYGSETNPNH